MNDFEKIERLFDDVWKVAQRTEPDDAVKRCVIVLSKMQKLLEILKTRGIEMVDNNFVTKPLVNQQVGTIEHCGKNPTERENY